MHVLITRAEDDAGDMKARLEGFGLTVSLAPLQSIAFEPINADALAGAAGIIATSRNGLRALHGAPALKAAHALPVFAVGPATAALAREMGFSSVVEGAGTASSLVPVITAKAAEFGGRHLLHFAGDTLAFDLAGALAGRGITVRTIPAYRASEISLLPETVQSQLALGQIDAVVLMSPRTARIWSALAKKTGIEGHLGHLTHVCLSPAVADGLQLRPSPEIVIAGAPNGQEIVSLIRRLAAGARTE